jgi:ribose transport system substrate-binding protein
MLKKVLVSGLAVLFALGVTACGGGGGGNDEAESEPEGDDAAVTETLAGEGVTIGFVGMTLNNEFHITLANGARDRAAELGASIDVQAGDQHASADQQLTIIENMLSNEVDGFIVVPSSSEGLESSLTKIREAGIPIVNADTKLNADIVEKAGFTEGIPFYGTDNYAGAKLAGEYVRDNFDQGVVTAILTGIEGHQNTSDRLNGFKDGAGDWIDVVAEQTANWEVDQGYTAAQNIISANPDLQLFFCSNDNMGIGALRAVQDAGLAEQIKIIGFDAVSEALNLVESGEFLATVAQDPAQMGVVSVDNLLAIINGEPFEEYVDTGCKLITLDNVAEQKEYVSQFVD